MKIQKLQEFTEMRRQRRFSEHPFVNESLTVNYETLLKVDNDLTTKAAIVFPTNVEYTKETINVIKDTIAEYVMANFCTEDIVDYEIGCLLCGEHTDNGISFNEESLCVLFSGISDNEILKDIAIRIMSKLDIYHSLLFTDNQKIGIDRFDEKEPRIKRLEE